MPIKPNASVVKMINQLGRERGEVVVEAFGVGKSARGQKHAFLRDRGSRSSGLMTPRLGTETLMTWQAPRIDPQRAGRRCPRPPCQ